MGIGRISSNFSRNFSGKLYLYAATQVYWGSTVRILFPFLCLLGISFATAADAATGDTVISVTYKVDTVRIRPEPAKGAGEGELHVVLHADGTVDDVVWGKGKNAKKWELKKRKLGSRSGKSAQWRVIDANTLERTFVDPAHVSKWKIVVDGKSCKAEISYTLKPGRKEYIFFSPQLGKTAYYSEAKPFDVQCRIE